MDELARYLRLPQLQRCYMDYMQVTEVCGIGSHQSEWHKTESARALEKIRKQKGEMIIEEARWSIG
jgi:hypothetical protein